MSARDLIESVANGDSPRRVIAELTEADDKSKILAGLEKAAKKQDKVSVGLKDPKQANLSNKFAQQIRKVAMMVKANKPTSEIRKYITSKHMMDLIPPNLSKKIM